ncbi:MAG: MXAN_6640 family putative metalloprotease [bacterium]
MFRLLSLIIGIFISASTALSQTHSENLRLLMQRAASLSAAIEEKGKCGFPTFAALHETTLKQPELTGLFNATFARPSLPLSYPTPDGRFRFHYTTTGVDAVNPASTIPAAVAAGVPDYIYEAVLAAQKADQLLRSTLGFDLPLSDQGQGGGNEYDVYVNNRPRAEYGSTAWDFLDASGRGPGYSFVDNDFVGYNTTGLAALRVTVAHEYFHGVQLNYRYRPQDTFFLEMSSTWFEDFSYDEVNDYYFYLRAFFNNPSTPLHESDGYESCIWLHYLAERTGTPRVVLDLWKDVKLEPAVNAFKTVLESAPYALPFSQALSEFNVWRYFTGPRADAVRYFQEGANYPPIIFERTVTMSLDSTISGGLSSLGANFYRVIRKPQNIQAFLQTDEPNRWMVTAISKNIQQQYVLTGGVGNTPITIATSGREDTVVVAVVNTSLPSSSGQAVFSNYQLQFNSGTKLQIADLLEKPRPNPFRGRGAVYFPFRLGQGAPVEAAILREDGRVMYRFKRRQLVAGVYPYELSWDGLDDSRNRVGSGVYFLLLRAGDFQAMTKFVVIN